MLRLTVLTLAGIYATLSVYGNDLTAEERAAFADIRENRTPFVAMLTDQFQEPVKRRGEYVPTLAELERNDVVPQPVKAAPQPQEDLVQLASLETTSDVAPAPAIRPVDPSKTTRVSAPEKLTALVEPSGRKTITLAQPSDAQLQAQQEMFLRRVTGTVVNVRSGPSTQYEVLGQVALNDIVRITSDPTNNWVKISVEGDGVEGFMSRKFLEAVEN